MQVHGIKTLYFLFFEDRNCYMPGAILHSQAIRSVAAKYDSGGYFEFQGMIYGGEPAGGYELDEEKCRRGRSKRETDSSGVP